MFYVMFTEQECSCGFSLYWNKVAGSSYQLVSQEVWLHLPEYQPMLTTGLRTHLN